MAWLDFDTEYLFYAFIGISAFLIFEAVYLLFFRSASYRQSINRRIELLKGQTDREGVLLQLRKERGLTKGGDYRLPVEYLNRLILQSGLSAGVGKLAVYIAVTAVLAAAAMHFIKGNMLYTGLALVFCLTLGPLLWLRFLRSRRQKKFGGQFPDALDIIVRSLRAGHPVPVAITMVGREMADPCGSEFGIVADEITYGSDLEGAMRNLYFRVGQDDLPLFVTAVAIQGSTGGNLSEILENLSGVIRLRFKMRRKVRALASEGRASATILASLPIAMFGIINLVAPDFYSSVWQHDLTKIALTAAGAWMSVGVFIMYRMVNFRI
ncbi:MAG: type II secretion system F family protein [Ferrovibrio sp.]